jgi:hypothetical protein
MANLTRLRCIVLIVLIAAALASSLWAVLRNGDWEGLALNLGTEMAGAAITYGLFELIIGIRERQEAEGRATAEEKARLIAELGSQVHDVAIAAAEELARQGWLYDGSLLGANLQGASLSEANLWKANLRGSHLVGANLSKAMLSEADLSEGYLYKADLREASLDGASLKHASLDNANLENAQGLTDKQLAEAFSLLGVTMPNGSRYNGRFNLKGDFITMHLMKILSTDESMAGFYQVTTEAYQWGQKWYKWSQSPPVPGDPEFEEWLAIAENPDGSHLFDFGWA